MSFGWSVGDIATAISLIAKLAQALDDAEGAAAEYREAVVFLVHLKRTLEPLRTFTALGAYPAYGDEIKEYVECIQGPINKCLAVAGKFDKGLNGQSKQGRHRNVGAKLQWRFQASKKVEKLRKEIDGHMRGLDSLLNRLALEMMWKILSNMQGEMQTAFTNSLDPRLVTLLNQQLDPMRKKLEESDQMRARDLGTVIARIEDQHTTFQPLQAQIKKCEQISIKQYEQVISKITQQDLAFANAFERIKEYMTSFTLKMDVEREKGAMDETDQSKASNRNEIRAHDKSLKTQELSCLKQPAVKESLWELYYLFLLSLGYLLRSLFLMMSTPFRLKPALTPVLIAKYHISFHDAIGRAPRVLDYDCFVNYNVFKAFLESSFSSHPGSSWVKEGLFQLVNAKSGTPIPPKFWSRMVSPGSHVNMSMLIDQYLTKNPPAAQSKCPVRSCEGVMRADSRNILTQCSLCGIEMLAPKSTSLKLGKLQRLHSPRVESEIRPKKINSQEIEIIDVEDVGDGKFPKAVFNRNAKKLQLDESDIIHFKRVSHTPISFLFIVNEMRTNDDPNQPGSAIARIINERWRTPEESRLIFAQKPGNVFRWKNGTVRLAEEYSWVEQSMGHANGRIYATDIHGSTVWPEYYRAASVFYTNSVHNFYAVRGDAGTRNIENYSAEDRWHPLTFLHQDGISYIEHAGDKSYLAGDLGSWTGQLLSTDYRGAICRPINGGLSGLLPIIIALIAFSCTKDDLERVLINDRAWRGRRWVPHNRISGRVPGRGMVVTVYRDPENPEGSTPEALHDLEYGPMPIFL